MVSGKDPLIVSHFGALLRQYRKDAGWSQPELARQLEKIGYEISTSAINKYELGKRRPGGGFIAYLMRCLQITDQREIDLFLEELSTDYLEDLVDQYDKARAHMSQGEDR